MRSLACFVGVGGEGWHHASWRRFLVQPLKSPACRRGMHHASWRMVFGADAEVSCLSERADIMHHGKIRLLGQRTKKQR